MKKSILTLSLLALFGISSQATADNMRILLVNDDGCDAFGLQELKSQLDAKGYDVWLVGPETNQSGIGTAITFKAGKEFDVKKLNDRAYCFPGTPADSLDFGLYGLLRDTPPDLVISGVNDGPNTGTSQLNSGTVSAAARAVRLGYPAIAASVGYIMTPEEMKSGWPSTHKYWPDSVTHVVELVDDLNKDWKSGQKVLPPKSGLSINYPALPKEKIKGIKFVENEYLVAPQILYEITAEGKAKQIINPEALKMRNDNSDTGYLDKGYITYTIFDGDWNAPEAKVKEYQNILKIK
ncbi:MULTISPECIES: 5'/3'-nucleotidase SurE [Providencia]|uniref:5'/3'-nucleotidase SurE n=1 Tax=Providencia TaxID=586 RepID=UPI000EF93652|nr:MULTISPECIES: 5'/3'-nucleotidase SurE [Providencia]MBQ0695651.1 5'/3'-nucleotidase SurE [Providencia stuartii]MDN7225471.1 5'/3'-nucleotidase SurE [Providencia stuartii]QIB31556.1 5'/3'-nucleotidase SurE [Providencia stuartii]QPN40126.1 5'/3'-nucleotidase SurE [Providencia sp. 2.29]RMA13988.1 5'/3'-nucleotidase SurE [Providencia stuartii]